MQGISLQDAVEIMKLHSPDSLEHQGALESIVLGYDLRSEVPVQNIERSILTRVIGYAALKHADEKRFTGGSYIRHPLEVSQFVNEMSHDFVATASAVLHDILESDVEKTQDRDAKEMLGWKYYMPFYAWLWKKFRDKIPAFDKAASTLHRDLRGIVDQTFIEYAGLPVDLFPSNLKKTFYQQMNHVRDIVYVLSRKRMNYYGDIADIFESDIGSENIARASLIKIGDGSNNVVTMDVPKKGLIDRFGEYFPSLTKIYEPETLSNLAAQRRYFRLVAAKMWNRLSHVFTAFSPYTVQDKRIRAYKNQIVLNPARNLRIDGETMLTHLESMKQEFRDYTKRHESQFESLPMRFSEFDELLLELRLDTALSSDLETLKKGLDQSNIYYTDVPKVTALIESIGTRGGFKSDPNDVRFFWRAEYIHRLKRKYNFDKHDVVSDIDGLLKHWEAYRVEDALLRTTRSTARVMGTNAYHIKVYHDLFGRAKRIEQEVYSHENIGQCTRPAGPVDGIVATYFDPRIRKSPFVRVKGMIDAFRKMKNLRGSLTLKRTMESFENPNYYLKGLSHRGVVLGGWGF